MVPANTSTSFCTPLRGSPTSMPYSFTVAPVRRTWPTSAASGLENAMMSGSTCRFSTITRSQTLAEPSNITEELWQASLHLLKTRLPAGFLPVRLLGMGVGSIDSSGLAQRQLFDEEERSRQSQLDTATDQIRSRFGSSALRRGSSLDHDVRQRPE